MDYILGWLVLILFILIIWGFCKVIKWIVKMGGGRHL